MVRANVILLVDDERAIRQVLRLALVQHDFRVIEASSGHEAIALVRQSDAPIHVLLTDVAMPGLDGYELARRLRCDHPGLRVVYMSGYAASGLVEYDLSNGTTYLQKPFDVETLVEAIGNVLKPSDRRCLELPEAVAV